MSIPLDDDMANWEFLDSVKGIRKKRKRYTKKKIFN